MYPIKGYPSALSNEIRLILRPACKFCFTVKAPFSSQAVCYL